MPTWVPLAKAESLPAIRAVYSRTGQFRRAALANLKAAGVWTRKAPGLSAISRKANSIQVDVAAIPGVRVLRKSGVKK